MKGVVPDMLTGQVAWVTASARGLGRAIIERLARCGASVVLHARSDRTPAEYDEAPSTQAVAEEIERLGVPVVTVYGDLSDADQVDAAVAEIQSRLGGIGILVNNAGGDIGAAGAKPEPNDAFGIPVADVAAIVDRNLMTTILCCRAVVPGMIERGGGRIVNIGSAAAYEGRTVGSIYATVKAGQAHYSRCLAAELRPHNITVNTVAPGGTVTARFVATNQASEELLAAMDQPTLVRHGRADEIACAVQFFVSPLAEFVSAQALRVDGGHQVVPA